MFYLFRMARFWILLFIVWYKAFTIVRTEDCEQLASLDPLESLQKNLKDDNDNELPHEQETNSNSQNKHHYEGGPEYKNEDIKLGEDISELMRAIKLVSPRTMYDLKLGNLVDDDVLFNDESFHENFNPYGTKDEFNVGDDDDDYRMYKRTFRTWGGKRIDPLSNYQIKRGLDFSRTLLKRPSFRLWGGKRSNDQDKVSLVKSDFKKIPFNKWAGKRAYDYGLRPDNLIKEHVDYISPLRDITSIGRKRLKFTTWGGKRFVNDESKRTFQPWKGK